MLGFRIKNNLFDIIGSMNHKNEVYWYTLKKPNIKKLTSDLSADIAIIGGGMAGLTCAQSLSGRGYRIVLLEKDFCGSGASGKRNRFAR